MGGPDRYSTEASHPCLRRPAHWHWEELSQDRSRSCVLALALATERSRPKAHRIPSRCPCRVRGRRLRVAFTSLEAAGLQDRTGTRIPTATRHIASAQHAAQRMDDLAAYRYRPAVWEENERISQILELLRFGPPLSCIEPCGAVRRVQPRVLTTEPPRSQSSRPTTDVGPSPPLSSGVLRSLARACQRHGPPPANATAHRHERGVIAVHSQPPVCQPCAQRHAVRPRRRIIAASARPCQ